MTIGGTAGVRVNCLWFQGVSDRNFHDDFGEFRSEGEYDSEFE